MNFTLALLAGLVLLLPGITALVSWNMQGAGQGAKRPELQLTSVSALFAALGIAIMMHVLGYGLVELLWAAGLELGTHMKPVGPLIDNPYEMALAVSLGSGKPTSGSVETFLIVTLFECLLAWRLIASPGLDLVMEEVDVRSQGWVFQHVVRPLRHGYTPVAYVMTTTPSGEYGIGYEGTVADIRQGDNGEIKSISLAEPQRFVYQVVPASTKAPKTKPHIVTHEREWVGGIVVIDGAMIRNIVVHSVLQELVLELDEAPAFAGEPPESVPSLSRSAAETDDAR